MSEVHNANLDHLSLEVAPENNEDNLLRQLLLVRMPGTLKEVVKSSFAIVRQLAWSPSRCSAINGCILSIVTNDCRV